MVTDFHDLHRWVGPDGEAVVLARDGRLLRRGPVGGFEVVAQRATLAEAQAHVARLPGRWTHREYGPDATLAAQRARARSCFRRLAERVRARRAEDVGLGELVELKRLYWELGELIARVTREGHHGD